MLSSFGGKFGLNGPGPGTFTGRTIGICGLSFSKLKVRNALQNDTFEGQESGIVGRHTCGCLHFHQRVLECLNELF